MLKLSKINIRDMVVLLLSILMVIGVAYGALINQDDQPIIMLLVFVAAILGSAVNQSQTGDTTISGEVPPYQQLIYFAWKLLVAMVFAILLYCIFISGIISGHMFPEFVGLDDNYVGTNKF